MTLTTCSPAAAPTAAVVSLREFPRDGFTLRLAARLDGRHAVTLRDDASGALLPFAVVFHEAEAAMRYIAKPTATRAFYA